MDTITSNLVQLFLVIVNSFIQTWYLWAIALVFAILLRFAPQILGKIGETKVRKLLDTLPKDNYFPIHNVLLRTDTGTSQIDHLVISTYGIFVIETKYYKGWIFGDEKVRRWTQSIYGNKRQFNNPIHQNYGHIQALKNLMPQYAADDFISIIAFSDRCTLKIQERQSMHVVYFSELLSVIQEFNKVRLSTDEQQKVSVFILNTNISDKAERRNHIKIIKQKQLSISKNICPKCGGALIEKDGRYGRFIACSNFPKCRYTHSLDK